jgi:hypothetical protein
MSTKVDAPPPRDYGQETRDTLQAQIDLAPDQFAAESEFRPQYTALDLQTLAQALRGGEGSPGLLELYEQDVAPALTRISGRDRDDRIAGELGALEQYAPQVTRTLREASGNAGITDRLTAQAIEGLDAGAGMDPTLANEVSQGVRAGQASRGFGFGMPDVVTEAFARGERGNQLRQQRQQFAGQVAGINQMTGGDPLMAILGRPSGTTAMLPGVTGQGQGLAAGNMFNPESAYAQDIFNTNYNAQAAANIASSNNMFGLLGAGIGGASRLGSASMKWWG